MPSATRSRSGLFHLCQTQSFMHFKSSDVRTFHCQKDNDTSVYASFTSPNNERWTDRLTVEGQPY